MIGGREEEKHHGRISTKCGNIVLNKLEGHALIPKTSIEILRGLVGTR